VTPAPCCYAPAPSAAWTRPRSPLEARVEAGAAEGGVTGTPTFVINGKKVSDHAMTLAELDAAIAAAAKK
jgi:hypothetical protein